MTYPNVDLLYLNEKDMLAAGVDDVVKCTDCMEELLKTLNNGDYRMGGSNGNSHGCMISFPDHSDFPNMPVNGPDRRFMAMPAYVGGKFDLAGMKWYGSNIHNREKGLPRSILMVMLNDKETGAPLSLMSGNLLSAYRTAGIPGVGVKHLAPKNAKVLGIVGPGVINSITVETFAGICPTLDTLKIKGRGRASIDRCISYVKEKCPQFKNIIVCDTLEDCIRDSDVISMCPSTPTDAGIQDYPFVKTEWIKKGALFCAPGAANFEDDLIINDAKLVVDNLKLYESWSEEYPYPTFATICILGSKFMDMVQDGKLDKSRITDLGAILNGKVPGRESDDQIILYSIGGMPVEDVAWGEEVYENAREKGIGTKLNLWEQPELY
ncbi:MAG: tyramine oxidase subunit B [Bacilli bacterium]|jgi:ornithine cyclodeaminase/alanine dehydrogenase-like protein (mu-crystallin family)